MARLTRSVGACCLAVLLAACGNDVTDETVRDPIPPPPASPIIESFLAGPGTVVAGAPSRLSWRVANAASIAIEDDAGNALALPDPTAAQGAVEVTPERDTRYTLTAAAKPGELGPVWRSVTVTVTPPPDAPPEIVSFTATPETVADDADVVLRWETRNVQVLALKDEAGHAVDLSGQAIAGGEVTVRPDARAAATTWILTAAGAGGHRVSAEVTVTRALAPRITVFTVLPLSNLEVGAEATIAWETSRTERVVITASDSTVLVDTTEELSGSRTVTLDRSTGYTLSATGPGGEATAAIQVPVGPKILAFASSLRVVRAEDPVRFDWQTSGADELHLTGPGGFAVAIPAADHGAGSQVVDVHESGDFTLTALRAGVARTWSIFIEVTAAPRVRSLAVRPVEITAAPDQPAAVEVSWVQDGGTTCTLIANNVPFPAAPCGGREGSALVPVTESTVFRFEAANLEGVHGLTGSVEAVAPARIVAFAKDPVRRLTPGDEVTLSWEALDAVSVRLERDGVTVLNAAPLAGTHTEAIPVESTFRLVAANRLGDVAVAELTVEAGAPEIVEFVATPPKVGVGAAFDLSWIVDGGESLTVTDAAGTTLCTTAVLAEIDAGTCATVAPAVAGTYDYGLAVTNGAGATSTLVLPVLVTDGPQIASFEASRSTITAGETVTLSWLVDDDASGRDPTLTLVDDHGNPYDVAGKNPNGDSLTVTLAAEGLTTFTLTAAADGTTPDARSVTVEVGVPPVIASFLADPATITTQGGTVFPPVTLSWTTENGVALSLWELDPSGSPIPPALVRLDAAQAATIAAGSHVVQPQVTTRYLARLTNRIGSTVEAIVKVVVDPVEILTFTADPVEIVAGEYATLEWTTANATEVTLDPDDPTTYDRSNAFLDVSAGGTQVQFTANYNKFETITFPAGFTFPFGGVDRTGVRMSTSGFLSFDLASTSNSTSNTTFPTSSTYAYVHLAPYWDYLNGYSTGTAWWKHATDAASGKQYVVFLWKNWSYYTSSAPTDLNFEVVLWEDGLFEYRYGTMYGGFTSGGTNYQDYADGKYATIGYQTPDGQAAYTLLHNTPFPGGLANRGWAFDLRTGLNYARPVNPTADETYTLTASNDDGEVSRTVDVKVHAPVNLQVAQVFPSAPEAGIPFQIRWKTNPATRVEVTDAAGTVVCTVTDPEQVAEGGCTHTEANGGNVSYTVTATNVLAHNVQSRTINAYVFPRLSIDASSVSAEFVTSGTSVTFTWQTTGALEAYLDLCVPRTGHGSCTSIDLSGQSPSSGSFTTALTESKEFWFRVFDGVGRAREVSYPVWVDAARLTGFTTSATQIPAGSTVTLSWSSTGASYASVSGSAPPALVEVTDGSAPYVDLSAAGSGALEVPVSGSIDHGTYTVTFPAGFQFPFFGKTYGAIRATTDGWLTFGVGDPVVEDFSNDPIPAAASPYLHLAPYWDDGNGPSKLYYKLENGPNGRYLILQYKSWSHYSSTYAGDHSFDVVLHESGNFEYRYGPMSASSSYPEYAAGKSATVGYQAPGGLVGSQLLYDQAYAGGLANRSFRATVTQPANGSMVVAPTETDTYRVCVTNASLFVECEEHRVVVVKPGHILVSELMIAPGADDGEWVEVRNTSLDPIDLGGWTLGSGAGESTALPPALVVPPGDYAVLARSADPAANGGVTPLAVYGSGIGFADAADEVTLTFAGTLIDRVAWTTGWPIQTGKSITLEPSAMAAAAMTVNDTVGSWCATTAVYGGGLAGSPGALGAGCLTGGGYAHYVLDPLATTPFLDISQTSTADLSSLFSSVYYSTAIPLGFTFPYFGDTVTDMQIGRHGYVTLAPVTSYWSSNGSLPSTSQPNGLVAAFWDYLYSRTGETRLQYEGRVVNGKKVMIVQWTKIASGSSSYGSQTFQIQLWEDGDIVFAYPEILKSGTYDYPFGSSATVGLENLAGTSAIQVFSGTSNTGYGPLYSGRVFHFHRK